MLMKQYKTDFPIFINQPELVYLDSAATSLKPQVVIDKVREYYEQYSVNVARGVYPLAERATEAYEATRDAVARFINAGSRDEVVFTSGTTEGINLLARGWGDVHVGKGDGVCVTVAEHHANFVPWQWLAQRQCADFVVVNVDDEGVFADIEKRVNKKTKVFTFSMVSNVLGAVNPVAETVARVRAIAPKALIVLDAAQAAPNMPIDVQVLGVDAVAFSAHKMLGPTGVGVLWAKQELLEVIEPLRMGGGMIREVTPTKTTFAPVPERLEGGTLNIAGIIGFCAAIAYLQKIGLEKVAEHERGLAVSFIDKCKAAFGETMEIYGPRDPEKRAGVVSFALRGIHAHDIAHLLGERNICVRAGHHCAMPLHATLMVPGTTRASFYVYNTQEDVEKLVGALQMVVERLG